MTTASPTVSTVPQPPGTQAQKSAFTAFWLFRTERTAAPRSDDERDAAVASITEVIARHEAKAQLRAAYSTAGLSAGVDLILWVISDSCAALQDLATDLRQTAGGQFLDMRHIYLGVASMSQYDPEHGAAFLRGLPPRQYLSVYPFSKTPDWYLLPWETRRDLMIEHGRMGQEFPSILTNTVNSFGIADQEFIVALEDDDPAVLVQMVQRLRGAEVRKYTLLDTPIFLGRRMELSEAIRTAI
jgi:peroxiredoxin